jgi:hypothetical protein
MLTFLNFLGQFGHKLEDTLHNAHIGQLENSV